MSKTTKTQTTKKATKAELRKRGLAAHLTTYSLRTARNRDELEVMVVEAEKKHAAAIRKPVAEEKAKERTRTKHATDHVQVNGTRSGVRVGDACVFLVHDEDDDRKYTGTWQGQRGSKIYMTTKRGKTRSFLASRVEKGEIEITFPAVEEAKAEQAAKDARPKAKDAKKHIESKASKKERKAKGASAQDQEIAEAWKQGVTIADLTKKYNMKRAAIRRAITKAVGGKAKFAEMREHGAGGVTRALFGRGANGEAPTVKDDGVKVIKSTKGWTGKTLYVNVGGPHLKGAPVYDPRVSVTVFTSPKTGKEYVQAQANEKADLVVDLSRKGLPNMRLRLYAKSATQRKVTKEQKLVEQGQAAHEAKQEVKKARKVRRAGGLKTAA